MFPFSRKKQKQQKQRTPSWVTWLVVAFLGYTLLTSDKKTAPTATQNKGGIEVNTSSPADTALPEAPAAKPAETIGSFIDPNKLSIDTLKNKFLPQAVKKMEIKDSTEGSGPFAVCGQKVTISYSSASEDKKEIEKEQNVTFQIGENKAMPALESGVIGMKKGGTRIISSPGNMAYSAENFSRGDVAPNTNVNFEVKLLEISPVLPDAGAFRILGDGQSSAKGYACGEQAKLQITLWDVEGKKLYSSADNDGAPVTFTIGRSEVFLGLEQGVLGMSPGMRRNLIVPPYLQKPLQGNPPKINFPLPKNQTVLVDVKSVP